MKKILFCLLLFFPFQIFAASAKITVSNNKNNVIVGDTVTVTVKISSSSILGSWKFDVVPSSNLELKSSSMGGLYIVDYGVGTTKSKTYTFTFKAKSSGTGTVTIKNSQVYGYDELEMSVTNGSVGFNMLTQRELEATYSKNNYLKDLKVEGYELSFDKDKLEYNLDVPNEVNKVNITATKEDSKSSIKGTGEIELSEGVNQVKIIVTAQNGSTRTYVININVKELKPIEVDVNGIKYNIIRKQEFMPNASSYYTLTTIEINGEEIPAYINEIIDFTLVGLKDSQGNTYLFKYDDGKYTIYNELSFNQLSIYLLDMDEKILPENYVIDKLDINGLGVVVYKNKQYEYPIVYGLNVLTGEKNLYKYDVKENTLQRYEQFELNNDLYFYIITSLIALIVVSYIIFIIFLIKNNNKRKKQLEKTINISKIKPSKINKKETDNVDISDMEKF